MSPEVAQPQPRSFPRSLTLFHYRGVPVRVDWSWVIIAALIGMGFYAVLDGDLDAGVGVTVVTAAVITVLFFASVLVHELGHAHTSLDRDVPVAAVTLFLLGGVTESTREARRARDEFVIVGAGPLLSLTLAAAFGLVWHFGHDASVYATVAGYLAGANLILGLANLVPGFPLDGGRLLRSIIWGLTQRPHTATRWAARVGQVFALSLGTGGLVSVATNATSSGGGSGGDGGFVSDINGLWLVLIALFLFRGASDAHRHARLRERVAGRTASDLMGSVPDSLDPEQRLHHAIRSVRTKPSLLWPVGEPMTGAVRQEDLDGVPRARWSLTSLGQIALPAAEVSVASDASMDTIMTRLQDAPGHMLVVVDDTGRAVGLLTPSLVVGSAQ